MSEHEASAPEREASAPANLRVSDQERDQAVKKLQQAVEHGLLTLDEFTGRTGQALVARHRGDLDSLLNDLPTASPTVREATVLTLETVHGRVRHRGPWTVPPVVRVRCHTGSVLVDFTQASCSHSEVLLEAVSTRSGSIIAVVPRGWLVRMESVSTGSGQVKNKTEGVHDGTGPVLRVFAQTVSGTVKIRHPR